MSVKHYGTLEPKKESDGISIVAWALVEADLVPRWRRILSWRPWRRGDYKRFSIYDEEKS